ncbi:MAG TPA: hypothetical protein PLI90_08655, partial [Rhodocyclaceae bacterium]|nr:hypothetical protein [Rhodocyclaceae bacterium]
FATGFLAATFFATGFLAATFFATGFLAAAFFATGFLALVLVPAISNLLNKVTGKKHQQQKPVRTCTDYPKLQQAATFEFFNAYSIHHRSAATRPGQIVPVFINSIQYGHYTADIGYRGIFWQQQSFILSVQYEGCGSTDPRVRRNVDEVQEFESGRSNGKNWAKHSSEFVRRFVRQHLNGNIGY